MYSANGHAQTLDVSHEQLNGHLAHDHNDGELLNGKLCDGCGSNLDQIWEQGVWQKKAMWRIKTDSAGNTFYRIHPRLGCYTHLVEKLDIRQKNSKFLLFAQATIVRGLLI